MLEDTPLNDDLLALVACPHEHASLARTDDELRCPHGHVFPILDGVPFLVRDDVSHPHWVGQLAVDYARARSVPAEWLAPPDSEDTIDPFVNEAVGATNGNLYRSVMGRLPRYPIPEFPIAPGRGRRLLDVGCNWGRWTIAASEAGFDAVGVDPSPEAVFAARRVARRLGRPCRFLVADARYLPFREGVFDVAFSYSVLQHLAPEDVELCARSLARVVTDEADIRIQMASALGVRSIYQVARRGFRRAREFEVRYWWPNDLVERFAECVGPTTLEAEGYLSLNAQTRDLDLLTRGGAAVVKVSSALVSLSKVVPGLTYLADSVWLRSRPQGTKRTADGPPSKEVD